MASTLHAVSALRDGPVEPYPQGRLRFHPAPTLSLNLRLRQSELASRDFTAPDSDPDYSDYTRPASPPPPAAPGPSSSSSVIASPLTGKAPVEVQSQQSVVIPSETLPVRVPADMAHYIIVIPEESSSRPQCFLYDKSESGAYRHIHLELSDFTDGHDASFAAGLEVGRMSALEKGHGDTEVGDGDKKGALFDMGCRVSDDGEEGGLALHGAQDALRRLLSKLSQTFETGVSLSLPIPTNTNSPHYVVTLPEDSTHPICFMYDPKSKSYKHLLDLMNFNANGNQSTSFVAGLEIGRTSVLESQFRQCDVGEEYYDMCWLSDMEDDDDDEEEENEPEDSEEVNGDLNSEWDEVCRMIHDECEMEGVLIHVDVIVEVHVDEGMRWDEKIEVEKNIDF